MSSVSPVSLGAPVSFDDVVAAASRLQGVAVRTPVITNPTIDEIAGAQVFLKAENLQRTGAFKFRGGYNAVRALTDEQLKAGVVAFSSGNHAQAVAMAATMCGSTSVIVMPTDAPPEKLAATKANGATVVEYDRYTESREDIAAEIAEREGRVLIPPYDRREVIAGQGTVGLELMEQVPNLDAIVVCVGGGGLLAGCVLAAKQHRPDIAVFGAEPEAGNDHALSAAAGERITIDVPRTIADGQAVQAPGELTWPINYEHVDAFPLVSDAELVDTMKILFTDAKLVVEPSGASALAAVLHRDLGLAGKKVGVTLSGGNIGLERFEKLIFTGSLETGSTAAGKQTS